ncbi:MAG: QueT transporter family protein [Oscillospiraceae bacterium]|nr:QueT transporter family protein [Oscillospiraceae bacterium]
MQKKEIFNVKNMTRLALVAAMYAVLTIVIAPLAFGEIQFRFSEVLVLLCFYRKDYAPALIVGCFIANLFSPMGLMDIIFGTLATAAAVIPMYYMKNIYLAALLPIVSNGIIVGTELTIAFGTPIWLNMLSVAFGELVVVGIIGIIVFKLLFETNSALPRIIGSTRKNNKTTV